MNDMIAIAGSRLTGRPKPNIGNNKRRGYQAKKSGGDEHTLSIPGGMENCRIYADFRSMALCQAPIGHFGSASGTVRETAHFRAADPKRTVRTVPHCRLAPMGKPMGRRMEGAAWPGSR